jgi:tRNA A37 threonylcarbamoyladenosine modification protein TsaB
MMLFINGSDIARLSLGLIDDDRSRFVIEPTVYNVRPEEYLATIDAFCAEHGTLREQITGIVAVLGPGSATALRTSLAFVNAYAFAQSLMIFGVTLEAKSDDRFVLLGLPALHPVSMVQPIYANDVNITVSGKDSLGRRLGERG